MAHGVFVPHQMEPRPLHWKHSVLIAALPGKSPSSLFGLVTINKIVSIKIELKKLTDSKKDASFSFDL